MRLIINQGEIKREIHGSFMLCGSKADLLSIAEQIKNTAEEHFSYGWVNIYSDIPKSIPDNPPRQWDE